MPRFSVVQKIGVGLLAVAFVPTLFTLIDVRRSHAGPLEFSVALHSDWNRLPEFKTEWPGVYMLSLRLNRTGMDPERQDCLLGIQKSTRQPCKILPVANFLYTVWNEIGIVETGQAGQDWKEIPGKDIALTFGHLKAHRGDRHRWEVLFLADPSELNSCKPTFIVQRRIDKEGEDMLLAMSLLLGVTIAVIGFLLVSLGWVLR